MSQSKHTPGPWRLEQDTTLVWGACDPDDSSDRGMGYPIAECRISPTSHLWAKEPKLDEGEANARLIAAAPKLKDALTAMLDYWGGYECPEVDAAIAVMQELGEDRWSMEAQMEAAKAEGRS